VRRLAASLASLALGAGCAASAPKAAPPRADAAQVGWQTDRLSLNGRAVYALAELDEVARDLIDRAATACPGRTPGIALYNFTLDGAKSHLGESIMQDLGSLMVKRAADRARVYTRRALTRVIEEQKLQVTAGMDPTTIARQGKLQGVDIIVSGAVSVRDDRELDVNCQLLEVETGRVLGGRLFALAPGRVTIDQPVQERFTPPPRKPGDEGAPAPFGASEMAHSLAESLPPRDGGWTIAVYPFSRSHEASSDGLRDSSDVNTELGNLHRPGLTPVTRERLSQVIKEQKLEHESGNFDVDTMCRLSALAGGNSVLTGYIEFFQDVYEVNAQVIDTDTGRIGAASILLVKR
jgi:TolB-like protein